MHIFLDEKNGIFWREDGGDMHIALSIGQGRTWNSKDDFTNIFSGKISPTKNIVHCKSKNLQKNLVKNLPLKKKKLTLAKLTLVLFV